jgi:hypothetical protein
MISTYVNSRPNSVAVLIVTLGVWLLLGLSLVVWVQKLFFYPTLLPMDSRATALVMAQRSQSNNQNFASLLGAEAESIKRAPDIALARLTLLGLVHTESDQGLALISIDKQFPKTYKIGARVGDKLILQSIHERSVTFRLDTSPGNLIEESSSEMFLQLNLSKPINATQSSSKSSEISQVPVGGTNK